MSIASANSASIADGPALKLFHSTFTCGPMAFSNQPLAFPIIACGWVIFGNAPTRITVSFPCACATVINPKIRPDRMAAQLRILRPFAAVNDHGQYLRFFLLSSRLPFADAGLRSIGNVMQAGAFQNPCCGIPYLEKNLIERAMRKVPIDEFAQRRGIAERSQGTIDQANNFAEVNFGRRTSQLVATLRAPHALDDACVLQLQQNQLKKLLRQDLFIR